MIGRRLYNGPRVGLPGSYDFVDATTGDVLHRVKTDNSEKDLDIETGDRGNSVAPFCWVGATDWFHEGGPTSDYPGGPGNFPGGDKDGDNAFFLADAVYNFYMLRFELDSYNNGGADIEAVVLCGDRRLTE